MTGLKNVRKTAVASVVRVNKKNSVPSAPTSMHSPESYLIGTSCGEKNYTSLRMVCFEKKVKD